MIIRLLEAEGADKSIDINLYQKIETISKTNMIEDNLVDLKQRGKVINIKIGKNSVNTYKMNGNTF